MTQKTIAALVVLGGVRTPFVKAGGAFRSLGADELGRVVVKELIERTGVGGDDVDEVVFGCVGQSAKTANVARVIALRSGVAEHVPAVTVHRNCASGMEAVVNAMLKSHAGRGEMFIVGGAESMSDYPLLYSRKLKDFLMRWKKADGLSEKLAARMSWRWDLLKPEVALLQGLTDPVHGLNMGQTAELVAQDFSLSRRMQDEFALRSHQLAAAAAARLKDEIVPVVSTDGVLVSADDTVRHDQSLDALAALKPVFDKRSGSVTAGNACPVSDGAAALLVASEAAAQAIGLEPLGRVIDYSVVGVDPTRMGLGPVHAIADLLTRRRMKLDDLDLIEINEAFAAQVLGVLAAMASPAYCNAKLGLAEPLGEVSGDVLNVNGGAVAIGHPVGASGTRLILTLLKELKRRGGGRGIASLCVGGGQGMAVLVEA